jgi:2-aminoadipate transaminase
MVLPWNSLLADADRYLKSSDIRDLLAVTARPDVISFAGGLPAPELFPVEGLRAAFDEVLRSDSAGALQYGPTEGYGPLREFVAEIMGRRGIQVKPDEVLLTTGSQQGLDLLGKVLVQRGAPVIVESPSYVGALQALSSREPELIAIPMDEDGLHVDHVAAKLQDFGRLNRGQRPALLYTIPTFQNPSGVTMTLDRRTQLLALCATHRLPVIEDDPYGELRFTGTPLPALRALPEGEETVHLGTFSKILTPGLRLGWTLGPRPLITRMVIAKQGTDLHTDSLVQRAVLRFCLDNDVEQHIARLRVVYAERRDAMLAALGRHLGTLARWTCPQGGFFIWVTLPNSIDARKLLARAVERKVAFVPGTAFHVDGDGRNTLRLNFSHTDPATIEEGVRRLADAIYSTIPVKGEEHAGIATARV